MTARCFQPQPPAYRIPAMLAAWACTLLLLATAAAAAQAPEATHRISQRASVSQNLGNDVISLDYSRPVAEPNDLRAPAGRLVDGVLHIELEAVEAEWYPRGPDGPRLVTPACLTPSLSERARRGKRGSSLPPAYRRSTTPMQLRRATTARGSLLAHSRRARSWAPW